MIQIYTRKDLRIPETALDLTPAEINKYVLSNTEFQKIYKDQLILVELSEDKFFVFKCRFNQQDEFINKETAYSLIKEINKFNDDNHIIEPIHNIDIDLKIRIKRTGIYRLLEMWEIIDPIYETVSLQFTNDEYRGSMGRYHYSKLNFETVKMKHTKIN